MTTRRIELRGDVAQPAPTHSPWYFTRTTDKAGECGIIEREHVHS